MNKLENFRQFINLWKLIDTQLNASVRERLFCTGVQLQFKFSELVDKFKDKYNITYQEIGKVLNVSSKQLRKWRAGTSPIPMDIIYYIAEDLEENLNDIENLIEFLSSSRGVSIKIPEKIDPKMLQIFGAFSGDGSCGIYRNDYKLSLKEKGKDYVHILQEYMFETFFILGKLTEYDNVAECIFRSKPLVLLFMQIFEYTQNFHKTFDAQPPKFLYKLDWELRKFFTTGLIDTEGSFYYDNSTQTNTFEIKMKNSAFINEIKECFHYFRIPFNYYFTPKTNPDTFRIRSFGMDTLMLITDILEPKNSRHSIGNTNFYVR